MTTQSQTGPGATPASGTEPLPHFPMVIGAAGGERNGTEV